MERPARFSVDIDIIVNPKITKEELEEFLNKIIESSDTFIRMELDDRRSYKAGVPKAHYKFIFKSNTFGATKEGQPIANPEREILLDVLFAENAYPKLVHRAINTEWLKLKSEPLIVQTPCVNSITGDKLTAFALFNRSSLL
ncbi:MAG: nucleotidyl transferase AbiEii/AbiGii toxin family protein [Bacteroidetes bacterium]|nr:nucleotidyl transferase AbiEii/AbiGii toxin family protein [Bacteroidota bacterium]